MSVIIKSGSESDIFGGVGADMSAVAGKKVVVGMSGGVDSSVAAYLLKRAGCDVIGLFMNNWKEEDGGVCTSATDWEDVIGVCGKLGIPYYSVDFSAEYMRNVFEDFLEEYRRGRTPNPDVLCNREIKFKPFKHYAKMLGADFVATGHYCGISHEDGDSKLQTAADIAKDQTYFLNQVSSQGLADVLFPRASMRKDEVREIALREGLVTAKKKDSTGICFIGERNFRNFLKTYLPAAPGEIRDLKGKTVGRHEGLMYYTLGQRRGLGIGGISGESENRWYVAEKDLKNNVLVVSCGNGEELYSKSLESGKLNLIGKYAFPKTLCCGVKVRYRQSEQKAQATLRADGTLHIEFEEKQRAVTEGQYAVLYDGGRCLGGATIEKVIK